MSIPERNQLAESIYSTINSKFTDYLKDHKTNKDDKSIQEARLNFFKNLSDKDKATLFKVLTFINFELVRLNYKDLEALESSLQKLKVVDEKKSPSNFALRVMKGIGNRFDRISSRTLEKKYTEATCHDIMKSLDRRKLEPEAAWQSLQNLHTPENPDVLYYQAKMLTEGVGTEKNDSEAIKHYKKAAELGHPDAIIHIAVSHQSVGEMELAESLLLEGAKQGKAKVQCELGQYYLEQKNYKEAEKWLKKAALHGDKNAIKSLIELGLKYMEGIEVPKNRRKAHHLFELGAKKGNVAAARELIEMYKELKHLSKVKEWQEFIEKKGQKEIQGLYE